MELLYNLMRNALSGPVTRAYPSVPHTPPEGARGRLEMAVEHCTFCGVCDKRCPTGAIKVLRKPTKSWSLQPHLCILCGYCIEVCPRDCLHMDACHRGPTSS